MAERLMEEVDIKIIEICPKYRINAYKNLDVDVVITNINLDIKSDYNNSSKHIYFDIAFWGDISIDLTYETLNRFRTL